ncbi:DUF5988 family protein [Streptomyces sp. NPDC003691]
MSPTEPNVVLRGGTSPYLPEVQRIRRVSDTDDTLKLLLGNRYEHFEPTAESETHQGVPLRVFRWVGSTKPAE